MCGLGGHELVRGFGGLDALGHGCFVIRRLGFLLLFSLLGLGLGLWLNGRWLCFGGR